MAQDPLFPMGFVDEMPVYNGNCQGTFRISSQRKSGREVGQGYDLAERAWNSDRHPLTTGAPPRNQELGRRGRLDQVGRLPPRPLLILARHPSCQGSVKKVGKWSFVDR